jgi:oxalate decarboxylase
MSEIQRRDFLAGAAAAAAATTALLTGTEPAEAESTEAGHRPPEPIRGNMGATILGPTNPAREAQSVDRLRPPVTDNGTLPTLRWSFADSHVKMREGGWSRQATRREIPSSTDFAMVNMRLKAGAVRELHWHKPAEWAFMLKGRARITAIDQEGRTFQDDVGEGDLWNFPSGIPHSIQGLEGDGCEFLLVFDDGDFSEDDTFGLTDWLAHTPREVLAKNFGVPERAFSGIPDKELFIFQAKVPGPLAANKVAGAGPVPTPYSHRMLAQKPIRTKSGTVRISDSTEFPAATTIAAAFVEVEPGGMRELHWHPNANEMQYYISGQARMTVFAAEGKAGTFDYQPGDVGFVPRNMGHYIENTGTTKLQFLELWKTDKFADVSLRQLLAFTPFDLVQAHLHIDRSVLANIPTRKTPVVPA